MDDMDMDMNHTMPKMNEMYFHFSKTVYHLLFESWSVHTDAGIFGAMVFSFSLAIVYEGFKTVKDMLASWTHNWLKPSHINKGKAINRGKATEKSALVEMSSTTKVRYRRLWKLWVMRAIQSMLRTIEIGMAYLLMLLAMSYNGWIFLSVIIGAGVGNFIFVHFRTASHDTQEHCG